MAKVKPSQICRAKKHERVEFRPFGGANLDYEMLVTNGV